MPTTTDASNDTGQTTAAANTPANEAVQKEIADLLSYVRQQTEAGVEGGKTLIRQQAPLVAHEIVAYKQAQACVMTAVLAAGVAATISATILAFRSKEYSDRRVVWSGAAWVVGAITSLAVVFTDASFLKPFFAPRLVVLEYVRHLL